MRPLTPLRRTLTPLFEHQQLLMICIATVLVMAGQGVISPVLPLFAQKFGVGNAAIGLTLSSFALARLLLNIPMGVLSDRYGRRMLLVAGPLVTAVGMIGSGLSGNIYQLLAWRFVAGAGSGMYMTGAQIYLADISGPATRARFIGTNQGALLLGTALGPAMGGVIADVWGLRAPFIVVGAGALIATGYAYLRIPETRHLALEAERSARVERNGAAPPPRAWLHFLRSRDFLLVAFVTFAVFFTRTAARQTLLPLLGSSHFGLSSGALGGLFTVMALINLVLIVPASLLADRYGRKWSIVPSGVLVGLSLFMLGGANGYAMFFGAAIVHAGAASIAGPAPVAYTVDIAPIELRGLAMGLYRSAGDIGYVIGPPLLGLIADRTSFGVALAANGVLMAAASLLFLFARETVTAESRAAGRLSREQVEG